jgi:hypothetical protein
MFIIVKNIRSRITLDDLENFVTPVLKGGWFRKNASVKAIKIIAMADRNGTVIQRHGLLRIVPPSEKKRVINALSKRMIGSEQYQVGDYVIRHWNNDGEDRRSTVRLSADGKPSERRHRGLHMVTTAERLKP